MKQKSHSGFKKRVDVRANGTLRVQKSCRRHLLINKSKRQKKFGSCGIEISPGRLKNVRRKLAI